MSTGPDRIPLLDPSGITLSYWHQHHWHSWLDDELDTWHVSAQTSRIGRRDDPHVGELEISVVDLFETLDPPDLLDRQGGELSRVGQVLFSSAGTELDPNLHHEIRPGDTRLLILHAVSFEPQWQGFGPLLAGTAIRKLSAGAGAAACCPEETSLSGEAWEELGFQHFRHGVHVLNLSRLILGDKLCQLYGAFERELAGRD